MTVNQKKSKEMIFSKIFTQKSKAHIFTLNNNKLDVVQEFTYLGVKLSKHWKLQYKLNTVKREGTTCLLLLNSYSWF